MPIDEGDGSREVDREEGRDLDLERERRLREVTEEVEAGGGSIIVCFPGAI